MEHEQAMFSNSFSFNEVIYNIDIKCQTTRNHKDILLNNSTDPTTYKYRTCKKAHV
jgi:hypothetical protein